MTFNFTKKNATQETPSQGVVIAEKELLNLQLLGSIQNGGAMISLGNNKGIKFTIGKPFKMQNGRSAHYVTVQIIEAGIGQEIKSQTWNRTKTVIKKAKPTVKKATMRNPKQGDAIEVNTKVESEDLF